MQGQRCAEHSQGDTLPAQQRTGASRPADITDDLHPQVRAVREAHRWSAVCACPDGRALEGLLADLPRDDLRAEAPCLRATAGMAVLVRQLDGWCRRVFPPAFSGGMGGKSVDDAYADGLANGNLGRWQVARPTFENISARPRLAWLCRSLLGLVGFQLWHPSFLASMRSTNDGSLSMATMRLARLNDIADDVSRALFWERQIGPSSVCKADIRKSFDTTSPRLAL